MTKFVAFVAFLLGILVNAHAVPPVLNYAGQVAVNGEAFDGNGLFKFALVNADGTTTYWSNDGTSVDGSEPQASVAVSVNGGLYAVLLGNTAQQGMGAIDPALFAQHTDAKLRVWFSDGVNGFQQLSPDRPFASVPYAFSAGTAQTAGSASIAAGSISKSMLGQDVLSDLNRTVTPQMIVLIHHHRPVERANPQIFKARNYPRSTGTRYLWRADRHPAIEAEGKYLSYQWYKNGQPISGATGDRYVIEDVDKSQHDGNYSPVSNDFGSVTTPTTTIDVNGTQQLTSCHLLIIWK